MALAGVSSLAVLYAVGLPYMALILNGYLHKSYDLSALLWAGMLPFLPFDAVKIVLACLMVPRLKPHFGNIHQPR
jgi:biotin transport system substrate-specific component